MEYYRSTSEGRIRGGGRRGGHVTVSGQVQDVSCGFQIPKVVVLLLLLLQWQYACAVTHRWLPPPSREGVLRRSTGVSVGRTRVSGECCPDPHCTYSVHGPGVDYARPSLHVPLSVPTPMFGMRLGLGKYLSKDTVYRSPRDERAGPSYSWTPKLVHNWSGGGGLAMSLPSSRTSFVS